MATLNTVPESVDTDALEQAAEDWLKAIDEALTHRDYAAAVLFLPHGHWRDLLAFTWTLATMNGAPAIEKTFAQRLTGIFSTA